MKGKELREALKAGKAEAFERDPDLARGKMITGILLHRFAPEAFRKVTFGVFAKEEKTPSGDTYVLKSYTYIHCDRAGNDQNVITTEYRYFANGLLQEEHLSADDSPDTYYDYIYVYNDAGYPTTIGRANRSSGYTVYMRVNPVLDEENVLNVYYLDDSINRIAFNFCSCSPLFKNVNLFSEETTKK